MKEKTPISERLTNQAHNPRLELGINSMPNESPTAERELTPETAADRVEEARKRSEAETKVRDFITSLSPEERQMFVEKMFEGEGLEGVGGQKTRKELKERNIKLLTQREERDKYFDQFFNLVDATPHEFFDNVFNRNLRKIYEYEDFIELISRGAIGELDELGIKTTDLRLDPNDAKGLEDFREDLRQDLTRYQTERKMRQYLHDVNAALYIPSLKAKQLYEHMQQFGSDTADLAFRTPGVVQMMNIYEQVLREDMAGNDGYLRPEAVLGKVTEKEEKDGKKVIVNVERSEIETETRKRFMDSVDRGEIFVRNSKGDPFVLTKDDFKQWQLDKTFTLARGMSIVSLRLISIAAESKIPKDAGRYTSSFLQDIIATYSPFVHLLGKYAITGKGLTPYLYESEKVKKVLGMFTDWDPTTMEAILEKYEKEGLQAIIDSPKFFYLKKLNPNRCGDIFTWLSWRANEGDSGASMIQRFVKRGHEKMDERWKNASIKKPDGISEEDYLNEYSNWIGTGLRFEKLRGTLEKLDPDKSWDENRSALNADGSKDAKEILDVMDKADEIFERMVSLQPHRLFLKSEAIQKRLGVSKDAISRIMGNLSRAEAALLRDREKLLEQGETFASVSLDFSVIPEAERAEAEEFAEKLRKDFDENRDKYYEEFVFRREFNHGFVLWDGDAPKNEFNFTALGATGVVRRARDNAAQEEAWTEEIKLLDAIEHVKSTDDLYKSLEAIHKKVDDYDKAKAQIATAEKAEAFAKFFAEASFTKLPVAGMIHKVFGDKVSMAKIVYGTEAPAWGSTEIRNFFQKLKHGQLISDEQYKKLHDKFATNLDVVADFGVTWAQLITLAIAFYLITKLLKEK